MWHNMVSFRNLQDEVHSIVLNFLKSVDKVLGTAIEKRVTVVQSGHDKGQEKLLCSFYRKIVMNGMMPRSSKFAVLTRFIT